MQRLIAGALDRGAWAVEVVKGCFEACVMYLLDGLGVHNGQSIGSHAHDLAVFVMCVEEDDMCLFAGCGLEE